MTKGKTKDLKDVRGEPGMITIKGLAEKFQITALRVSQILKETGIEPVGKLPCLDAVSKKPCPGKPAMAFEETAASKALEQATGVKVSMTGAA